MNDTFKLTEDQAYWLDQLWYGIQGRDGLVTEFKDLYWEDLFFLAQQTIINGTYSLQDKEIFNKVRKLVLTKKIVLDLDEYEASETSWLEPYCKTD
jgi:hypothetical protein